MDGSPGEWNADLPGSQFMASNRMRLHVRQNLQRFPEALEELPIRPENTCLIWKGNEDSLSVPNSHLLQGDASVLHKPPGEGFTV